VRGDLEALGYAVGSLPIEAACAGAEQLRDRYWFVADCDIERGEPAGARLRPGSSTSEARHDAGGRSVLVNGIEPGLEGHARDGGDAREESQAAGSAAEAGLQFRSGAVADSAGKRSWTRLREGLAIIDGDGAASDSREFDLAICRIDGKVRRIKPGLRLVADGIPARVDKLRALGNAIDPRPAAAFIRAAMQCIGAAA
jgi:DNA (cytosine-5)-methyltransferase 1